MYQRINTEGMKNASSATLMYRTTLWLSSSADMESKKT